MTTNHTPVIRINDFKKIQDNDTVKIFDVRTGPNAKQLYEEKHIQKAVFVSLDHDLANIGDFEIGGRHPLPDPHTFAETLGQLGIDPATHVIVYDDKNGANAAARFWWMLKAIGHNNVQVLDGGLQNAELNKIPMNTGNETNNATVYTPNKWTLPTKTIQEVEKATSNPQAYIIDVRESQRYNGITEPIDLVAGHIPNAHNIPFSENLDEQGLFLSKSALREKYEPIFSNYKYEDIIVHCGSGVTACHTLLAMDLAGYQIPNLYVGSWSEWSRNKI